MPVELKPVIAHLALVNARVISLFSYKLSNALHSYQSKKLLKLNGSFVEALRLFLSLHQEKEFNSFIPTKPDLSGQPNKIIPNQKLRNISSLLDMKTCPFLELQVSGSF